MASSDKRVFESESTYAMLESRLQYWVREAESFLSHRERDQDEEEFMKRVLLSSRSEFAAYRGIRCKERETALEKQAERLLRQIEGIDQMKNIEEFLGSKS